MRKQKTIKLNNELSWNADLKLIARQNGITEDFSDYNEYQVKVRNPKTNKVIRYEWRLTFYWNE